MFVDVKKKNPTDNLNTNRTFITKEYRIELSKKASDFMNTLELMDGLLKVTYKREIPESEKPKQIKIKSK